MYQYRCKILKVIDGDTVDVDIDLGFGICITDERVRIMGIDTPESRTRDLTEKAFGLASKNRLKELLPEDSYQVLKTEVSKNGEDMKGKFGRILGDFLIGEKRVTEYLIEEGHAVPYHGQSKDDVQEQHLINRSRLLAEGKVELPKD